MAMAANDIPAGIAPAPPAPPAPTNNNSDSTSNNSLPQASSVTVSLHDLQHGTIPFSTLEAAFGPTSLGILIVSDLPSKFTPLRQKLLTSASRLASLPAPILDSLTQPSAKYLVGWSHGRETLPPKQQPDFHKGSYYVNCAFYQDSGLDAAPKTDAFPDFPEYTSGNVWPPEEVMPGFRDVFEELCKLVIDVAALVARAVDGYARERVEGYATAADDDDQRTRVKDGKVGEVGMGYLERVVRGSYTTKARLLHYFPPGAVGVDKDATGQEGQNKKGKGDEEEEDDDAWCTTHLDHGCLTGLLSAMYLPTTSTTSSSTAPSTSSTSPQLEEEPESIPCPDPTAGLYIHSRTGTPVKVSFPPTCLAFQTGEALQKITQGRFRAVPHYVSPGRDKVAMRGVERNTLAVFTQPNLEDVVDRGTGECFGGFARGVVGRNTVQG